MKTETAPKIFVSARAAQIAMTRAEKAYSAIKYTDGTGEYFALLDKGMAPRKASSEIKRRTRAINAAREHARNIYNAAREQGFYPRSFYFGANGTRDLVLANID